MKICIHRGTQEIGGTCIELEAEGKRIVLDVGLPLDASEYSDEQSLLPKVSGFKEPDESLLAVVISHPHQDHYGLSKYLRDDLPIIIGEAAHNILKASLYFSPSGVSFENIIHLRDRELINIGPFEITPYLVDHSAYDAYAILVSAGGKKLFYSGDFRGHGRKSRLFDKLIANPPRDMDVLLMEGTNIGRSNSGNGFKSEEDLVQDFIDEFNTTNGLCIVWSSSQNIDRLVTIFKACRKTKRQFIIDLYTAEILRATGNDKLPQWDWEGVRVFLPKPQKYRIMKEGLFDLAKGYKKSRIYPENLAKEASKSVMLFRPSMIGDLENAKCLQDAKIVYSLWEGYLKMDQQRPFLNWIEKLNLPLVQIHTSGHAAIDDLKKFANSINPKKLVPIHSFNTDRYSEFFDRVENKKDGVWWDV
ncbi:MAG: MBL fold metallo-hydrolase [Nitrospinae bacterium]|nr:MBL fold metallo-hydrolase [Nitrospinota bacterium]